MLKLLFMDERFAHKNEDKTVQATSLTCLLVDMNDHVNFRDRYYALLRGILCDDSNVVPQLPIIHAMDLFPDRDDADRLSLFEGITHIVQELDFKIFRIGYRENRHFGRSQNDEKEVLSLCFHSVLHCLEKELLVSTIWPVMEIDRGHQNQDRSFPGALRSLDFLTAVIGKATMSIDNANLGEVLYHSKQSAYGAVVDVVSYLLHVYFRRTEGDRLSPFKQRLAEFGADLHASAVWDEVIDLQIGQPPSDYQAVGPIRWAFPITPRD